MDSSQETSKVNYNDGEYIHQHMNDYSNQNNRSYRNNNYQSRYAPTHQNKSYNQNYRRQQNNINNRNITRYEPHNNGQYDYSHSHQRRPYPRYQPKHNQHSNSNRFAKENLNSVRVDKPQIETDQYHCMDGRMSRQYLERLNKWQIIKKCKENDIGLTKSTKDIMISGLLSKYNEIMIALSNMGNESRAQHGDPLRFNQMKENKLIISYWFRKNTATRAVLSQEIVSLVSKYGVDERIIFWRRYGEDDADIISFSIKPYHRCSIDDFDGGKSLQLYSNGTYAYSTSVENDYYGTFHDSQHYGIWSIGKAVNGHIRVIVLKGFGFCGEKTQKKITTEIPTNDNLF